MIWDGGGNFSKFAERGSHRGASYRGTWTRCINHWRYRVFSWKEKIIGSAPKLRVPIFSEISDIEYDNPKLFNLNFWNLDLNPERKFKSLTERQCNKPIEQDKHHDPEVEINMIKSKLLGAKMRNQNIPQELTQRMDLKNIPLSNIGQERGTLSWVLKLSLSGEGYATIKQLFWDLTRIRYGWQLTRPPVKYSCGGYFKLQHALWCQKSGFVSIPHVIKYKM